MMGVNSLRSNRSPVSRQKLARTLDQLVQAHVPNTDEVHIRLYGGWYDEVGLSNDGSRLTQDIGRDFPIALSGLGGQMRRIYCEIASSLVESRSDLFPATVRNTHGPNWSNSNRRLL